MQFAFNVYYYKKQPVLLPLMYDPFLFHKSFVGVKNKDIGPIVDLICGRYDKTREPSQPGQVSF